MRGPSSHLRRDPRRQEAWRRRRRRGNSSASSRTVRTKATAWSLRWRSLRQRLSPRMRMGQLAERRPPHPAPAETNPREKQRRGPTNVRALPRRHASRRLQAQGKRVCPICSSAPPAGAHLPIDADPLPQMPAAPSLSARLTPTFFPRRAAKIGTAWEGRHRQRRPRPGRAKPAAAASVTAPAASPGSTGSCKVPQPPTTTTPRTCARTTPARAHVRRARGGQREAHRAGASCGGGKREAAQGRVPRAG